MKNFLVKYIKEILLSFLIVLILFLWYRGINKNIKGGKIKYTKIIEFEKLMAAFETIFPDKNRNAGGPQFFKYIAELHLSKENFELYNTFYCGVSGSPIDPKREKTYDYIIVKNLKGEPIYGKYYRCCQPCICDVMKYAYVDKYDAIFDNKCVTYDVLTIDDPCCSKNNIPKSVTSFTCKDKKTENGIHTKNGKLIFALFHDTNIATKENIEQVSKTAFTSCAKRMNTSPEDLQGGMGDIFVKLSLACKNHNKLKNNYGNSHTHLKNIYGEPLKQCKKILTNENQGSWDSNGYCSEDGGGVHQICFSVDQNTSDFSTETGQSNWSETRIGNNHCMCLGAWALYKAKNKGNNKELVCESIPEMSLDTRYVKNWNTWNGNELPNQIVKGVDNLVKQCYNENGKTSSSQTYLKQKYDELRDQYQNWNSII